MSPKLKLSSKPMIALVYRGNTSAAKDLAKMLTKWLKQKKYKVYTAPDQKKIPGTQMTNKHGISKMGLVIALGGDGTYLRAARLLHGLKIPILGVNLGSLGFLTPVRVEEVFSTVEHTLENKMELVPRAMLEIEPIIRGKKKEKLLALNDLVLERGSLSQLINIGIYQDKMLLSDVKADGIIVATPTGSTAYNISAGGPILHPDVQAFVITAIAPHALTNRPFIMPDNQKVRLKLVGKAQRAHLVVDGKTVYDISTGDEVVISRSVNEHWMVKEPDLDYFHLLREKLKFGDRAK